MMQRRPAAAGASLLGHVHVIITQLHVGYGNCDCCCLTQVQWLPASMLCLLLRGLGGL
jgi:hypothetical protein